MNRTVNLHALVNAKKQARNRKVNELISIEEEDQRLQEDIKYKNQVPVDDQFLLTFIGKKKANWGGIWKSVKNIDRDNNGFLSL